MFVSSYFENQPTVILALITKLDLCLAYNTLLRHRHEIVFILEVLLILLMSNLSNAKTR